jgi:hypothetical protein
MKFNSDAHPSVIYSSKDTGFVGLSFRRGVTPKHLPSKKQITSHILHEICSIPRWNPPILAGPSLWMVIVEKTREINYFACSKSVLRWLIVP